MSYVVDHYYVNESIFYLLEFIITLKYTCIENACTVYQNLHLQYANLIHSGK